MKNALGNKTLIQRLAFDRDAELIRLIELFREGRAPVFSSGMKPHFRIAKQKPDSFKNHKSALGISLGGTNLKLMIASMKDGRMRVEHVKSMPIPQQPTDFYAFFDGLLIRDECVKEYLKRESGTCMGFSFPMSINGKAPYHPTKVPNLNGIIARSMDEVTPELDFDWNIKKYFESRALPLVKLFYQSDGIIAHHGAVSLCDVRPDDSTTLIICGTGLASGDEENYIQMGIAPIIDGDEELYPADATENHQYHYAVAGKGLFGLMDRCIKIKAGEPGSQLGKYDLHAYFCDSHGSQTMTRIWQSSLEGGSLEGSAAEIFDIIGKEAFSELQEITAMLMKRTIGSIANSVVATIVKMGPAGNGHGHALFFEGGIATNKYVLPRLKSEIADCIDNIRLFRRIGVTRPLMPDMDNILKPLIAGEGIEASGLADIDITLIGSVSSVIADDCLKERNICE